MKPLRFGKQSVLNDRARREERERLERERALERDLSRDARRAGLGTGVRIMPAVEKDEHDVE